MRGFLCGYDVKFDVNAAIICRCCNVACELHF